MASKLTQAFETYIRDSVVNHTPVVFDEFIFANIPGLNDDNLDSHLTMPQANQIVHRQAVSQIGALNENAIVYSVTIGTEIGDFDFNWVGLVNKSQNLLACGIYTGLTSKIKNKEQKQGNSITRSVLLEFPRAQELANVSVSAETWQIDFTMRLSGIDEKIRLTNRDLYGRAVFFDNAFLLKRKSGNVYTLDSGHAYIEGVRAEIKRTAEVTVPTLPASVYVDICHHATVTGAYQTEIKYLTQSKNDYVGSDGYQHYVQIIADIASNGAITDRRLTDNAPPYIAESKKSSSVSSTSEKTVATSKAVKTAYDRAVAANNNADSRVSKSGGEMTGGLKLKANFGVPEKKWDYSGFYAGSATLNNEALPYFQIHIGSYGGNTAGYAKSLGFDLINYKAYVMNWNSEGEYAGKKEILTELHRSDSVTSASSDTVATSKAVKTAYGKAVDANNNANNRVAKTGDTMTGTLYFARANETYRVGTWDWRNVIKINGDGLIGNEQTAIAFNNNGNLHLGGSRNGKWRATLQERFLETRSIVTANAGSGSYVDQYRNNDAPFFVDASGSNARDVYFPFIKGRVRSTNQYGTALSFGYVTKGGGSPDGFGAGIVHLIEGNGSNWRWEFKHGGDFRSAGDVVTSAGTSLNALNNKVTQLQPSQNLSENGWCRLPNGLIMQWGKREGNVGGIAYTFPIPFPTKVLNVSVTIITNRADKDNITTFGVYNQNTTGFSMFNWVSPIQGIYWFAIGH